MNKLATAEQLVNGRARKILQNHVNTLLPHHIQWVMYHQVKLMALIVPLYVLHLDISMGENAL